MPVIARCTGIGGIQITDPGAPAPFGAYLMDYDLNWGGGMGRFEWTPDRWDAKVFTDELEARQLITGLRQLDIFDMTYETGPPYRAAHREGRWVVEDLTTGDVSPYPLGLWPGEEMTRRGAMEVAWRLNKQFIAEGGLS